MVRETYRRLRQKMLAQHYDGEPPETDDALELLQIETFGGPRLLAIPVDVTPEEAARREEWIHGRGVEVRQ